MLKNKSFYGLLGIVIILITIAVYASTNPKTPNTLSIPTSTPKISVKNTPEGWKTYTSQNLGFALAYPSLMEIPPLFYHPPPLYTHVPLFPAAFGSASLNPALFGL